MTKTTTLLFSVTLRHLTADGKRAAADLPPANLHHVSPSQLHTLLRAVNAIAPMVALPAEPEIRISGPTGDFVVRVKEEQLHLVSWSSAHKGGAVSPAEIMVAVSGEEPAETVSRGAPAVPRRAADKLSLVALGLAILLVNCFTVWVVTRPPRTLAAKAKLLPPEPAERLLAQVAGAYETGKSSGDRRLEIRRDASVQRVKLGPGGAVKDQQTFTVQPAEANGKRVLVTSRKSLITVKDNVSVVLYGDTYTRVMN